MSIWCLATILCGFAGNFTELFILRVLASVGEAALHPAAFSLIADYFEPERRGRAIGVYTMGGFVGAGLATVVGSLAILATGSTVMYVPFLGEVASWKAAFILIGVPGAGVTAAMLAVREPFRQERGSEGPGSAGTLAFIRRNASILSLSILGISFNALANYSLINWAPTFFIRDFGWQPSSIELFTG